LFGGKEEGVLYFCGYLFLGFQYPEWLLATIEEALKAPVKKDFVSSYCEDAKALMVRGGANKASRYIFSFFFFLISKRI
jgi:hypothetical protein